MARVINLLFRESPYWGWLIVGVLFLGLALAWLLGEHFGARSRQGSRVVVRVRSTVFTAFVVLDLVVLILLSGLHPARVDLTRDNLYSLSDASRGLVSKLDDVVTAEVFFPEEIPPEMVPFRESLVDLLDEFRDAAAGQMVVRYLDPRDPGVVERAESLGIKPAPFQTIEAGKQVTKELMRGLAISYRGRTETIPVIDRGVGLEYQIATLVLTLTGKPRKIGMLTGHKELDDALGQPQMLDTLKNVLSYHELVTIDLQGGAKAVPEDVTALIMTTPTDPIPEAELYQIDQFLMRGGALAFMGNGFSVTQPPEQMRMMGQMQMPEIKPLDPVLRGFLEHFGISVGDDVVLDDDSDDDVPQRVVGLSTTRGGALQREYALVSNVFWTKDIEARHPVTFGLSNLLSYQASTVDLSADVRDRDDISVSVLVRSTEHTWVGTSSEVMMPMAFGGPTPQEPPKIREGASDEERARAERGSRSLLVAVEGPMTSYFEGKDVPAPATAAADRRSRSDRPVRVMGLGSPIPVIPEALKGGLSGDSRLKDIPTLLLNTTDWLVAEKGLMDVRAKTVEPPPFTKNPDAEHQRLSTLALIGGWPFLFAVVSLGLMAVLRTYRRRGSDAGRRSAAGPGAGEADRGGPKGAGGGDEPAGDDEAKADSEVKS